MQIASRWSIVLEETIELPDNIGHDLEIIQIFETAFRDDPALRTDLVEIFIDLITFWSKLIVFLRRKNGKN